MIDNHINTIDLPDPCKEKSWKACRTVEEHGTNVEWERFESLRIGLASLFEKIRGKVPYAALSTNLFVLSSVASDQSVLTGYITKDLVLV